MRSEFNEWYAKWTGSKVKCENTDIIAAWQHQQSKVDDLEHENTLLRNRLSALECKLRVYPKYMQQLKDRNAELQERVDAVKQLIQEYRDPPTEDKTFCHALSIVAYELEQALKGSEV